MDDLQKQMITLLNARDEQALQLLSTHFGRLLTSLARRILGSDEDAEECVNDVLLEVWNTIPPAAPGSVSSYACMLTRRTAIDRLRISNAQKRGGGELCASLDELGELEVELEEDGNETEVTEVIEMFLDGLSRQDRYLFVGRYYFFEDVTSLAHRLGIRPGAASRRLLRMRRELRELLAKRGINI